MTTPIQVSYAYEIRDAKGENVAHCRVKEAPGGLWMTDVWCAPDERRKGHASALVARAVADWRHRAIYLSVEPYTDQPLNADALALFYARYGFVATNVPGVMVRPAEVNR